MSYAVKCANVAVPDNYNGNSFLFFFFFLLNLVESLFY